MEVRLQSRPLPGAVSGLARCTSRELDLVIKSNTSVKATLAGRARHPPRAAATYAAGPSFDYLPILRQVGGVLLIVLGLNLAGVLRIPALDRTWRPLEAGAAGSRGERDGHDGARIAGTAGSGAGTGARFGDRLGGRIVERPRWLARVVRARRDLRDRLDAVHRRDPRRHPDPRRDQRLGRPGRDPPRRLHRWASVSRSCSSLPPTTGRRGCSLPSSAAASSCPRSAARSSSRSASRCSSTGWRSCRSSSPSTPRSDDRADRTRARQSNPPTRGRSGAAASARSACARSRSRSSR